MKLIEHPEKFTAGIRVLSLVSRNKDGVDAPNVSVVSYSTEEFYEHLSKLQTKAVEGQRIYASIEERDPNKAIREFKRRQLDADYDQDTLQFYTKLKSQWESCLMKPSSSKEKYWLIDCDSDFEYDTAHDILEEHYDRDFLYEYNTKNGKHIIIKPFNMSSGFNLGVDKNAVMLWAY